MSERLNLTSGERVELDELLGGASLGQMLRQWAEFVQAVERGYEDSIYEYMNDLSVRDQLEKLILMSSSALAAKLNAEFSSLDERFVNATEPARHSLSAAHGDVGAWWQRVPRRRAGELEEDLKALGHVE